MDTLNKITINIRFSKGGTISGILNNNISNLPSLKKLINNKIKVVRHSRWSGREINFEVGEMCNFERENQSINLSEGDIVLWRDWRNTDDCMAVLAIYYGAEQARSSCGFEPVNVIGKVNYQDFDISQEVGKRIWQEGFEEAFITIS